MFTCEGLFEYIDAYVHPLVYKTTPPNVCLYTVDTDYTEQSDTEDSVSDAELSHSNQFVYLPVRFQSVRVAALLVQ
jgi:hypothetical protein